MIARLLLVQEFRDMVSFITNYFYKKLSFLVSGVWKQDASPTPNRVVACVRRQIIWRVFVTDM